MRNPALVCSLVLLCVAPVRAAEETWVKVQTPHFLVLSNGSQKDARDVGAGFEQIHAVFALVFPKLRTDSGAQTIVLAVRDAKSFAAVLPSEKKRADNIAGQFIKGWEKDYVPVRLDTVGDSREVVYHEYIHKLLHLNFTRLPVWLDEGLVEFYANSEFHKDQVLIGTPSPRVGFLRARTPYPLPVILSATANSPYYQDPDKAGMFYAESWALTHFLTFGDGMGSGDRMSTYLVRLQQGADRDKAFEEVFGDPKDVEKRFFQYTGRFKFSSFVLHQSLNVDAAAFIGAPMPAVERDARLGDMYTRTSEIELATARLKAALAEDSQYPLAHENMAFLYFRQGKDEEARAEFDKAVSLDPKSYLAEYYQAMLAYHGKSDADSLAKLDGAMQTVLQLNPRFAPAMVARSQIRVRQHNLQEGLDFALQAEELEPDRAGYLTNAAAILLLGGQYSEAAKMAAVVAARSTDSDSAEALAVLKQARQRGAIPATQEEQAREAVEMKYAEGTVAVEGVLKSTACDKMKLTEVVLQTADKLQTFHLGKEFSSGFSDTLWYGRDHFSLCVHMEGMNAVVRYKPAADTATPAELRGLEIRDDIIPTSAAVSAN